MHHVSTCMQHSAVVCGLGMMGGSLAAALHEAGWQVHLHHRRPEVTRAAAARGWGTPLASLAEIPADCELAVLGTPVEVVPDLVRQLAAHPHLAITDMGSTKAMVCRELADLRGFVGSHPMCGSHLQGLDNADAGLFRGATAVLTPGPHTAASATSLAEACWRAVGCHCLVLDPEQHDRLVAQASHLPHVLARLSARLLSEEASALAASGFRDTSRVAAAPAELWAGILTDNASAVSAGLAAAQAELASLQTLLDAGDRAGVTAWLDEARRRRAAFDRRREND